MIQAEKEMLEMKKNKKEMDVVYILDRSRSIQRTEKATIRGYKKKLKK